MANGFGLDVHKPTIEEYAAAILSPSGLKLARYGDGEWHCILGHEGQNCDGHLYYSDLGDDLRRAMANPNHTHGFLTIARLAGVASVTRYLADYNLNRLGWHDGGVIAETSIKGGMRPLVEALHQVRVGYVGPGRLRGLNDLLTPLVGYVKTQAINAYRDKARIRREAIGLIRENKAQAVGFSCGPLAKVLIAELADLFPRVSLIDFGSIWDGYFGTLTRSYMCEADYPAMIAANGLNPLMSREDYLKRGWEQAVRSGGLKERWG